jgi:hypothetical protein
MGRHEFGLGLLRLLARRLVGPRAELLELLIACCCWACASPRIASDAISAAAPQRCVWGRPWQCRAGPCGAGRVSDAFAITLVSFLLQASALV